MYNQLTDAQLTATNHAWPHDPYVIAEMHSRGMGGFDPGPAPSAADLIAAQDTLEAYDGREEDIPAPDALEAFGTHTDERMPLLGDDAEECNDTTLLTFEHAHALLIEGHTLITPATLDGRGERSWRLGSQGVDGPLWHMDGQDTDQDTFAYELARVCADADAIPDDLSPVGHVAGIIAMCGALDVAEAKLLHAHLTEMLKAAHEL